MTTQYIFSDHLRSATTPTASSSLVAHESNTSNPEAGLPQINPPSLHLPSINVSRPLPLFSSTSPPKTVTQSVVEVPARRSSKHQAERRHARLNSSTMSPSTVDSPTGHSRGNSDSSSYETNATSLPALQVNGCAEDPEALEPVKEEDIDPTSFDLVAPAEGPILQYSLETRSELLFSKAHLKIIFGDPSLLLRFTAFLSSSRPSSIPVLIYYLDAVKALKAISYSNAIAEALEPIPGCDFTNHTAKPTVNELLEQKADQAFEVMVREDLPAYVTHTYIQTVSLSIQRRITGTLPARLREASEGLAEVFCLTDPSRPDNPIVFSSDEFHRTTQYGTSYVIGRNCRFLQGPKTNPFSVRRIRDKVDAGEEHCEVFLNYRRDGSPFMNLLMIAPLCDSRGKIRYFIGAQVDVSGLVKECSDLESLERLVVASENSEAKDKLDSTKSEDEAEPARKDEFQELSEMLNMQELDTVRRWGGRMHREKQEEAADAGAAANWNKPRLLIHSSSPDGSKDFSSVSRINGKLSGVYGNYLLVRPYPSLRILFASPSLRMPGILQSPFMAKIGGSSRVRDELTQAFAEGRGVTAKIRWVTKLDVDGRNRWIHCTPLIGSNGAIGVWMVVIVDDENDTSAARFRQAPPVDPRFGRDFRSKDDQSSIRDSESLRGFALENGGRDLSFGPPARHLRGNNVSTEGRDSNASMRSGSPYTLNLG